MNFYDLQTLLKLGSVVQWMAIIFLFLGVSLQITKFVIDKHMGDIRDQIIRDRTAKYETTITTLKTKVVQQHKLLKERKEKIKHQLIPETIISKMTTHFSKYKGASVRITCLREDDGAISFSEHGMSAMKPMIRWPVLTIFKVTL